MLVIRSHYAATPLQTRGRGFISRVREEEEGERGTTESEPAAMDLQGSEFDRLLFFEAARKTSEANYAKNPLDAEVSTVLTAAASLLGFFLRYLGYWRHFCHDLLPLLHCCWRIRGASAPAIPPVFSDEYILRLRRWAWGGWLLGVILGLGANRVRGNRLEGRGQVELFKGNRPSEAGKDKGGRGDDRRDNKVLWAAF